MMINRSCLELESAIGKEKRHNLQYYCSLVLFHLICLIESLIEAEVSSWNAMTVQRSLLVQLAAEIKLCTVCMVRGCIESVADHEGKMWRPI